MRFVQHITVAGYPCSSTASMHLRAVTAAVLSLKDPSIATDMCGQGDHT